MLVDREDALFGPMPKDLVFTTGLVALAAKMAKSDGVVTRSEVDAFERIVEVPRRPSTRASRASSTSPRRRPTASRPMPGRSPTLSATSPKLLEDVLDGLFHIAKADGAVHEAELAYLNAVAAIFGIDERDFDCVAARHVRREDDPYVILGVERS